MSSITCPICPHGCRLEEGRTGFCGARSNRGGEIRCLNYGQITSLSLDPIEKKPLRRFYPGSRILSAGSYGCNLRCPWCQNYEISSADSGRLRAVSLTPEELVSRALSLRSQGNIGLAYTYNEPLIGYEFVRDCSLLIEKEGLKNVLVTNGYINEAPLRELLPHIHALNIDLKSFSPAFYRRLRGNVETVKNSIAAASECSHVEVTLLVIPGENDSPEEMRSLSSWLASVDPRIPLHVTRFFPRYHMTDRPATSVDTVYSLARIAREKLEYVYEGNC
ncbi:AmmeMemoRadiSam system radical SAM enzyme [Papillibacter cinnamivorans]|uniref:Pyruvate formate lyase activating enzyme n=1 Tax=Papillibacter cinnamivorans DSM 12816 TaxID=1122930 RepID=A0A1W2BT58_9FIRM|nr:AmmeMemoRadiSam system radical SAM enzyme [Papillibacter cinnamivorans]SMC76143.1 pyruvate formate lyase activating enzyme [Papillibacter cinnamivorans DSM 12816]